MLSLFSCTYSYDRPFILLKQDFKHAFKSDFHWFRKINYLMIFGQNFKISTIVLSINERKLIGGLTTIICSSNPFVMSVLTHTYHPWEKNRSKSKCKQINGLKWTFCGEYLNLEKKIPVIFYFVQLRQFLVWIYLSFEVVKTLQDENGVSRQQLGDNSL